MVKWEEIYFMHEHLNSAIRIGNKTYPLRPGANEINIVRKQKTG